jgi:plastocyanin
MKAAKNLFRFSFGLASVLLLAPSMPVLGATSNVTVANFSFTPSTLSINAGDTVIWTWASGASGHNVVSTSTPFAWFFPAPGGGPGNPSDQNNSNTRSNPFSFTNTFNAAGSFPYECTVHAGFGMVGTINVAGVSQPPTISITNPVNNAVFAAPANVHLGALASSTSGTVTNVQFFTNGVSVGSVTTAPFALTANGLAAGSYALTASATAAGLSATSSVVNISVVTPVAVTLKNPTTPSTANFEFTYSANVGLNYEVDRASSLAPPNWVPIATNVAASNPTNYLDTNATNNPAFYRVDRLPNP